MTLDDARAIHWRHAGLLDAAFIVEEAASSFGDSADPFEICQALAKKIESQAERVKANIPPKLHEQLIEVLMKEFGNKLRS